MSIRERISNFIKTGTPFVSDGGTESAFVTREKVIAFLFAFIFAFCLWFIINLNRDFTVTLNLPILIDNMPEDKALSSGIPEFASVSLNGEGWQLISLYNNPPKVNLDIESEEVNIFDQIRQQLGVNTDVRVINVQPSIVELKLEEKITKKVPVVTRMDLTLRDQFGIVGHPSIEPDSVTLTGAESRLTNIMAWETEPVELKDVHQNVEKELNLVSPDRIISIEPAKVTYTVRVTEFTEGEIRVPIRTRNMPSGKAVTYNPSTITISYSVPIDEYAEVREMRPFIAFVNYQSILEDDTGFIIPEIEQVTNDFHIRLKNYLPSRVAYFHIVDE